jgi:ribonucleoside-diphosphate reductase alpha chain
MMDNPDILFNAKYQRESAKIAVETNEIWAEKLKINKAARITCIKPEGTNSIVLSAASGIHPHHSRKYFRRIQCNTVDNVYKFFKLYNEHACEESTWSANKTDDIITFPIEIPETAMIKADLTALQHLDLIKLTQKNWVESGTTSVNKKPLHHCVSCTVIVKDDEWNDVERYLYDNQNFFTAVSLLPSSGDKTYKQAPMEAVITEEDELRFNKLVSEWSKVNYKKLEEDEDDTLHIAEPACAGGQCIL